MNMKKNSIIRKIVIIGAGGFGRNVLDIFDALNKERKEYELLGFIVEAQYGTPGKLVNNKPILGDFNWLAKHAEEVYTICAVGLPELRLSLVERAQEAGARFCNAIAPSALLTPWMSIDVGTVIGTGSILCNQISLGNHVPSHYPLLSS